MCWHLDVHYMCSDLKFVTKTHYLDTEKKKNEKDMLEDIKLM